MTKIFKVGGCIRDKFLGIDSKDIDFTYVCESSNTVEEGWEEMSSWMKSRGFEVFLETPSCFTIRARFPEDHVHSGLVADFVMARKEVGYEEGTRRPILELGTIEDDLLRRDFTVNALAEDEEGNLIDLFNGRDDLEKKILRTPLPAQQTMMDDPLRILRALRFSITKGFNIHDDIYDAIQQSQILEKLEKVVSAERIREELMKMMNHNTLESLIILEEMEKRVPGFKSVIFGRGLWLKPTFEKR